MTQQWNTKRNVNLETVMHSTIDKFWKAVFSAYPCRGYIWANRNLTDRPTDQAKSVESRVVCNLQLGDRKSPPGEGEGGGGAQILSFRSNAESSCEIGASQLGQKPLNREGEGSTGLEAVTRQLMKIEHAEI
jgi:hypothetical protein